MPHSPSASVPADRTSRAVSRLAAAALLVPLALTGCVAPSSPLAEAAPAAAETDTADVRAPNVVAIATGEGTATISGSPKIDRLIEEHAREAGVPPALAYAVVRVESRYNPKAKGAGVYGLSQIMPATARSLGFSGPTSALLDADTNLEYGMKYLKGAWEKSGHDVCRTAMKYKGGHRAERMTASTKKYCAAVKSHMAELAEKRGVVGRSVPATVAQGEAATPGVANKVASVLFPSDADAKDRSAPAAAVPAQISTGTVATESGKSGRVHSEPDTTALAARLDGAPEVPAPTPAPR